MHPAFLQFERYQGTPPEGFDINFLGQRTSRQFGSPSASFAKWIADPKSGTEYPTVSEEYFEWIAALEAVLEAQGTLTMLELGAGYGRWLVVAACAARRRRPDLALRLVGVEPEPTHFAYLRQHLIDNGVAPEDHELIQAVVNSTGEEASFIVGHPQEWYGQAVVPQGYRQAEYPSAHTIMVDAVRLVDLLRRHPYVDLVDMDIQGAELDVVTASIAEMTKRVRRAYISTHSREVHQDIVAQFRTARWTPVAIHGWKGKSEKTRFGRASFVDGIQYWINPYAAHVGDRG